MSEEFCYMEELKKSKSKNRTAEKSIGKRTNEKNPYSLLSEIQYPIKTKARSPLIKIYYAKVG